MTGPVWDGDGVDPWLPSRLSAQAQIVQAERSLFDDFLARLSGWLVTVARAVLRSGRPDPVAVWSRAPDWAREADGFVRGPVRDVVGQQFAPLLGDGYRWDLRPGVAAHLAAVSNRLVGVPDDVYALIASEVAEGANAGEPIRDIADRVDEVLSATATPRWANRSTVVARTETLGALNAGRHEAFQAFAEETGEQDLERMWLCVAPDTPIAAATAVAAARRHYKGTLVCLLTESGRSVAVTPQHPVLTRRGWLPACLVNEGDHLFQVVGIEPSRAPDVDDVPAKAGECIDAAIASEPVKVRTMPTAVDLHCDAIHSQVEVVPVDRDLAARLESGVPEGAEDLFLTHADDLGFVPELTDSDALTNVLWDGLAEFGLPNPLRPAPLDVIGLLRCPDAPGLALAADGDAGLSQYPVDGRQRAAVHSGHVPGACAAEVVGDNRRGVQVIASTSLYPKSLCSARLCDGLGSGSEPSAGGLRWVQQFPLGGKPAPNGRRTDRQVAGNLAGRLAGTVPTDDVLDVQRPRGVGGGVTAMIDQDADDSAGADAERFGDRSGPLAPVEAAEHVRDDDRSSAAGLAGGGLVSDLNASVAEDPPDGAAGHSELGGNRPGGCAGFVAADEVVRIDAIPWDAHVYDLSTLTGWYAADGLVVHNSTDDHRTRATHREADRQRAGLTTPFRVGGVPLMFPGDPTGPPDLVIQCRCTTLLVAPGEDVDLTDRGWKN